MSLASTDELSIQRFFKDISYCLKHCCLLVISRQNVAVTRMTCASPTCQHKATIQLLNLLSHLVFVPPDVRIEVRKVGPVHSLWHSQVQRQSLL